MKRLLLVPGYTEDGSIFAPLRPLLPAGLAVVAVDLAPALAGWRPLGPVNVASVARRLAAVYAITAADVVLGHSMGGWLAAYIKQETGCTAVLLSGFTHQDRIVARAWNLGLLRLVVHSGLLQSRWLTQRFRRRYQFEESRQLYHQLLEQTRHLGRAHLYQQLQVLFAPAPPLTVEPDLRLHGRRDHIIRPPREAYVEIAGDHFGHYFYPQQVAAALRPLLGE